MKNIKPIVWFPLVAAVMFVAGLMCDTLLRKDSGRSLSEQKMSHILNLIENEYVDEVDLDSLLEATFPSLLANLDPHSVYIPASELQQVNDELEGSFSGVGIQFNIDTDTIMVVEAIAGGPSEKVGIKAGDRIIKIDNKNVAGIGVSNEDVFKQLRGEKDTKVTLTIKRTGAKKPLTFEVIRGDIPVASVDAAYMLKPGIGYVKVNKFGRTTYDEFYTALGDLSDKGAKSFVLDLRGNTGGLMDQAVLMVNEFLPGGLKIVETRGRNGADNTIIGSDGSGRYQDAEITVLIDEYSASASEIFAGAVQDNDRGLVIGRRSFGKGLVQHQIDLPDMSAIRLTVSRYYTPSGRCIQKDYTNAASYENDLLMRYEHGEAFEADSIKLDKNLEFKTLSGRKVYGGGGIMPDIFIPNDTIGVTSYFVNVANAGMFQKYALQYTDNNRIGLEEAKTAQELVKMLPPDDILLRSFVNYCSEVGGIPARWYYINISRDLIVNHLKALIARDVLGMGAYFEIINQTDPNVESAIMQITSGKAKAPIKNEKTEKISETSTSRFALPISALTKPVLATGRA